jgi:hypothetical protein
MKPADWKNQGWYERLFEANFLWAVGGLLSLFLLIEIPGAVSVLRSKDAETLSAIARLLLLCKVFATSLLGALIVAIPSRLAAMFLFQPFERMVQGVATLFFILVSILFSLLNALAANAPLASRYPALEWLTVHGPRGYRTFLVLLWGIALTMTLARIVKTPPSPSGRLLRLTLTVGAIAALLGVDFLVSANSRYIAPENRETGADNNLTILIPGLTPTDLATVLSDTRLSEWKLDVKTQGEMVAASTSVLSQAITILTGMQPWEHGVRSSYLSESEQRSIARFLETRIERNGVRTEIRSIGSTTPLAVLLDESRFHLCSEEQTTASVIALTDELFFTYSVVPDQIFSWIFPESKCTQNLAPLTNLASQEVSDSNHAFRRPNRVHSFWWINPARIKNHTSEEENAIRLQILADTLSVFANNLELTRLRGSTRISIVGLASRNTGSFAIIAPQGLPVAKLPKQGIVRVGTAQLTHIIAGETPPENIPVYQEEISSQVRGFLGAELSQAVFYSPRSLYCTWGTGEKLTSVVRIRPTPGSIEIDQSQLKGVTIPWPLFASEAECLQYFRTEFDSLLKSDISLLNHRPLVALLQKTSLFGGTRQ